jgi:hypothetical protein
MNKLEIFILKLARRIIIKTVGTRCITKDTEDFPELREPFAEMCETCTSGGICFVCKAYEAVDEINHMIELYD